MVWNHRVVKRTIKPAVIAEAETFYEIHEAYYPAIGAPADSITMDAVDPVGGSIKELREVLRLMTRALDAPVLNYEDFYR